MRRASIATAVLVLAACSGDKPLPTAPVAAVPSPSPTPTPGPLGQGLGCGLPVMPECGQTVGPPEGDPPGVWGCCTREAGVGHFQSMVSAAINKLQVEQPSLFNGNRVLDRVAYLQGVARILERDFRVCAEPGGPGVEVAVKNTNDFSEQYGVYVSTGVIFDPPSHVVTCTPARF